MALLTRAQIDKAQGRKYEDVPVPEWADGDPNAKVRIAELSSTDRGYIEAGQIVARGQSAEFRVDSIKTNREKVVALALVDENFERLYSNKEIAELGRKSSVVIDRLFQVAVRISGMNPQDVKEAEGNSGAVPSGSSDSD